ncbi:cytochrome P450 [Streptomyces sp. NPDC006356]
MKVDAASPKASTKSGVKALLSDPRFVRPTAEDKGAARIAEDLVDDMVRHGQSADLKADLGFPLPVYVICDILGVPATDRDRFSHWSDAFLNVSRYTGEDLISMVIREGEGEEQGLTDDELLGTAMGLVRTAVDEALRFDANLGFGIRRYLAEDAEADGELLPRGTTVVCSMPAANRDERVFTDADDMVLSRSPNPHLTFGAGPHSCLGPSLARTELQVTLDVLLRKLPTLRLAVSIDELQRVEALLVGGLSTVPVRW